MIDYNNIQNKSVCLLLSGGVDSAVSLYELVSHDIIPDCWYIKIGPDEEDGYNCNSDEDIEMCTWLTSHFNCKFNIINLHKEYWDNVTQYTMDKVKKGLTPNPDVMCNTLIKFGAFYDKIGHKYDYIATGHYAQTALYDSEVWMTTSPDPVKDQTDFLCNIDARLISKILFPIGHMYKEEIRKIAEEQNLINKKRKDSQGICFLGKVNYNDYIKKFLGEKGGNIVEFETGKILGKHNGHWFHTIGQRKGLKLGGGPWYCVKKDINKNIVFVSKTKQDIKPKSYGLGKYVCYEFSIHDINWLIPSNIYNSVYDKALQHGEVLSIYFKYRHSPEKYKGTLHREPNGTYMIRTQETIQGVAPGQFCVMYDFMYDKVLGSGEITM